MPRPCSFHHGSRMMRILVKGTSIRHLAFALEALMREKEVRVHILTEEPEIGLSQSLQPGSRLNAHPTLETLARHLPRDTDKNTLIRSMWISRALGIEAAERGATIHLRSSLIEHTNNTFRITGAGRISNDPISFDYIYDPEVEEREKWFGASFSDPCEEEKCLPRGDGTCEFWSKKPIVSTASLETSIWFGNDPFQTIPIEIDRGITDARDSLQLPKYS